MKGSEVYEMKLTTLNVVSPVASISLLIGSDVHHFVFTVYFLPHVCETKVKPLTYLDNPWER